MNEWVNTTKEEGKHDIGDDDDHCIFEDYFVQVRIYSEP